jgi:hypothetical protein
MLLLLLLLLRLLALLCAGIQPPGQGIQAK